MNDDPNRIIFTVPLDKNSNIHKFLERLTDEQKKSLISNIEGHIEMGSIILFLARLYARDKNTLEYVNCSVKDTVNEFAIYALELVEKYTEEK